MVILLLSVLAAVAIPNFIDMRTDAKNAATKGALGALRSAISITRAAIALKESPNATPKYPTVLEMQTNAFNGSHPTLSGTSIMAPSSGTPKNPWSASSFSSSTHNTISDGLDCLGGYNGRKDWYNNDCTSSIGPGWMYQATSGEIWANTYGNGGYYSADYDVDCSKKDPNEACF